MVVKNLWGGGGGGGTDYFILHTRKLVTRPLKYIVSSIRSYP